MKPAISSDMSPVDSDGNVDRHNELPLSAVTVTSNSVRPPSPAKAIANPVGPYTFLTAIAAQERRVLELREDYLKAERELLRLKTQWARHEMVKEKDQPKDLAQIHESGLVTSRDMRSVRSGTIGTISKAGRRRAESSSTRSGQRKVFSGSRHARTLSLLSERAPATCLPKQHPSKSPGIILDASKEFEQTIDDSANQICQASNLRNGENVALQESQILFDTGRQLVGDFSTGFRSFFEDLRQLTVGDEPSKEPEGRSHAIHVSPAMEGASTKARVEIKTELKQTSSAAAAAVDHASKTSHERLAANIAHGYLKPLQEARSDIGEAHFRESKKRHDESVDFVLSPLSENGNDQKHSRKLSNVNGLPSMTQCEGLTDIDKSWPSEMAQSSTDVQWLSLPGFAVGNLAKTATRFMNDWEKSLRPPLQEQPGSKEEIAGRRGM